jgi:hypothetical protein
VAADWIDAHQLGRRNLTPEQLSLLRGRRYNRLKREPHDGGRGKLRSGPQNEDHFKTAQRLTVNRPKNPRGGDRKSAKSSCKSCNLIGEPTRERLTVNPHGGDRKSSSQNENLIAVSGMISAADWIDAHQLGRRNLTPEQMSLLHRRRYNRLKKAARFKPENAGGPGRGKTVPHFEEPFSTAQQLAEDLGVSPATIKRHGQFAAAVPSTRLAWAKPCRHGTNRRKVRPTGQGRRSVPQTIGEETESAACGAHIII